MLFDVAAGTHDDYERDVIAPTCGSCFYCGQEIQKIAVFWRGAAIASNKIALHPACAMRLALHLAKDGAIGERIEQGVDPLSGISRVLGRHHG